MTSPLTWKSLNVSYKLFEFVHGTRQFTWNPQNKSFHTLQKQHRTLSYFNQFVIFLFNGVVPVLVFYLRVAVPRKMVELEPRPIAVMECVLMCILFIVQSITVGCFCTVRATKGDLVSSLNTFIKMDQLLSTWSKKSKNGIPQSTILNKILGIDLYAVLMGSIGPLFSLFPIFIPIPLVHLNSDAVGQFFPSEIKWLLPVVYFRIAILTISLYEAATLIAQVHVATFLLPIRIGVSCIKRMKRNLEYLTVFPSDYFGTNLNPNRKEDMADVQPPRVVKVDQLQLYKMVQITFTTMNLYLAGSFLVMKGGAFILIIMSNYIAFMLFDKIPLVIWGQVVLLTVVVTSLMAVYLRLAGGAMERSKDLLRIWKSTAGGQKKLQRLRLKGLRPIAFYSGGFYPLQKSTLPTYMDMVTDFSISMILSV